MRTACRQKRTHADALVIPGMWPSPDVVAAKRPLVIAALLGLLMQTPAVPAPRDFGFLTADALAERCNSDFPGDVAYCFAYVAGVHDTIRAYEVWLSLKEFCPPPELMQADFRRIFLTYLKAHPNLGKGQAASTVVVALKTAFPCPIEPPAPPEEAQAPGD